MVLKSQLKNPTDCPVLYNQDFYNFILPDEPFAKALRNLKTRVLVNYNA